jgi:hypothetical protein
MARMLAEGADAGAAAEALAVAILSNTVLKRGLAAAVVGRGRFRVVTVAGLAAIRLAIGASVLLRRWAGG